MALSKGELESNKGPRYLNIEVALKIRKSGSEICLCALALCFGKLIDPTILDQG